MKRCMMMGFAIGMAIAASQLVSAGPYMDSDDFEIKTTSDRVWQLRMYYDLLAYEKQANPSDSHQEHLTNFQGPFELSRFFPELTPDPVETDDIPLSPDAWARSRFTADFFQRGNDWFVRGFLIGDGSAEKNLPGDVATAKTRSRIETRSTLVDHNGDLNWRPNWVTRAEVEDGDFNSEKTEGARSSVDVTWRNLDTNTIVSTRLFDGVISVTDGTSMLDNGMLTLSAMMGFVRIDMDSPYLSSPHGSMLLEFDQGLVTTSEDNGVFAGLLPPVGTSSLGIMMHLGDPQGYFNLSYDFGETSASGFDVTFDIGAEGSAEDVPSPASAPFLLLGVLGAAGGRRRRE